MFGWLASWLPAGQPPHKITIHVLSEQYFSLTTISRNSIFQSCRTGPQDQQTSDSGYVLDGKKRKAWMLDAAQNQQGRDSFAEYRLQISWVDTVANLHQDQLFRSQLFACMKWTSRQRQRNSDRHSSSRFTQGATGSAQSVNLSNFLKMNISKLI